MYYIGIDLGGTNIKAGLIDEHGTILTREQVPTGADRHYEEIIKDMAQVALKAAGDIPLDQIVSVGVGSPGSCDEKNGVLIYTNNINFRNVPIRTEMQKYIDKPIYLGNDANCAALGEFKMLQEDVSDFVFITIGTGIGGGIIIDKKLYTGFNGSAGELGHITLYADGRQCTCGRNGCLEAYASVTGLIRLTKEAMEQDKNTLMWELCQDDLENVGGKTSFLAAKQGDSLGKQVVDNWIHMLSCGIVDYINIFQPEYLLLGGAICKEGDYLLNPIKQKVEQSIYTRDIPQTKIQIASLGNDAGLIGAAFLC